MSGALPVSPRQVLAPLSSRVHAPALLALASLLVALAGCGRMNPTAPELRSSAVARPSSASGLAPAASAMLASDAPVHLEGEIGPGALWTIDVPAAWNGDLVVYLHGYTDPAAPVATPGFGPVRDALLARGFAVAASSYSENGYAVQEGTNQSHQLSGIFASRVRQPEHTYLLGQSLGGLIGLLLSQKFPGSYDGSLLVCGVVGGSDDEVQYLGDIRVLFDAIYPGVLSGDLEHPGPITNMNQDVVVPVLQAVNVRPQGLALIQALARRPLPGNSVPEIVNALITVLGFTQQGGGDLFDRTHGHSFFDNAEWRYTSAALPAAVVDDINARVARYTRTPDALAFLANYGEPSGDLRTPVLSLHTSRDPVVPYFHEELLDQVAAGPWLLQRRVERFGHCNFTADELMANFDALVAWSRSGQKPAI
jgi:pimeloyl-ACP methyl ester carboxylesterase